MINISIQEAMRCLQLFQEYQSENGYVSQCFDLAISALKTIEDMTENGQEPPKPNVSRETLKVLASFNCKGLSCSECIYSTYDKDGDHQCMSLTARDILLYEQKVKEVEQWITTHYQN